MMAGSLIISEIHFDPEPTVGLPPYEYAEWYNNSQDTVFLAGWQWVAGDKKRLLTGGMVCPGGYVIVCSQAAAKSFTAYGQVIAIESFPSLRNTGDRLTLIDPGGTAVHSVEYSPDQYTDALKANGGWSLELADYSRYCTSQAWLPSIDPSGGTPGRANSQEITLPPGEPPLLIRAAGYDDLHFVLLFSEMLNPQPGMNNYSCRIMPGAIPVIEERLPEYGFPGLFFQYPDGLSRDLTYTVELAGTVGDCSGQNVLLRPVQLGFPSEPDSAGIIITEVMFDPQPGQTEFIEVYNRSERVIELKDLILARTDANGKIISFSDQQVLSFWLFPDSYAVWPADAGMFRKAWPLSDPVCLAVRTDLPSLTNMESRLILMDRSQKILDMATYSPDWHYPYLDDNKGVSLERIDFNLSGTDRGNWFSASGTSGGSTPGLENSCIKRTPSGNSRQFSLEPAIGYSNRDPDPVQVAVRYRFTNAGWFMRISVYNNGGQPVREIFPFGMAASEGLVCWNGLDAAERMVPDGIYLVVVEYYHPSGEKGRWKKACAVVRAY